MISLIIFEGRAQKPTKSESIKQQHPANSRGFIVQTLFVCAMNSGPAHIPAAFGADSNRLADLDEAWHASLQARLELRVLQLVRRGGAFDAGLGLRDLQIHRLGKLIAHELAVMKLRGE